MSYRLLLALLILASACTPSANATERFRQNSDNNPAEGVVDVDGTLVEETEPIVPRPVGAGLTATETGNGSASSADLTGSMSWTQLVRKFNFTVEVAVDIDFGGTLIPPVAESDLAPAERRYLINGAVRVNASSGTCLSITARSRCTLAAALDASIVGVATEQNGELILRLSWRTFGIDQAPSRVGFSIAERSADAAPGSTPFAVTPIAAVADGLEWSGLIGGTLFVDVRTGAPLRLSANIGSGFGDGLLYVVADN
ncbi:MAG: hypothetical protein GXP35_18880 [Actinobacteria bacterium]|nr:hypothetical protein [Actinomycetota bacterium]